MYADTGACRRRLPDDQVGLVVEVFRMLADATRVQVLWALVEREMSVNDLAEHVGKPAPSVSQHLAKLRMARLVHTPRAAGGTGGALDARAAGARAVKIGRVAPGAAPPGRLLCGVFPGGGALRAATTPTSPPPRPPPPLGIPLAGGPRAPPRRYT